MSDLSDLIRNLGGDVEAAFGRNMSRPGGRAGVRPAGRTGRTGGAQRPARRRANAVQLDMSLASKPVGKQDDGYDTLGILADLAKGAIRVIDTPRAVVTSAINEIADAVGEGDASFGDFIRQARTGEVSGSSLLDRAGMGGGWQRSTLGFGLDVLLDPLTYVTMGVAPVAGAVGKAATREAVERAGMEAADAALSAAVKAGSSKSLTDAIVRSATDAGFEKIAKGASKGAFVDESVNKLIAEVATRGRGALTPRGLARAGVADDVIQRLGIPELQRTVGVGRARVTLPGTTRLAETAEDIKGLAKAKVRSRPAGDVFRRKFLPERGGYRDLTRELMNTGLPASRRAAAAVARTTDAGSARVALRWAALTERENVQMLNDPELFPKALRTDDETFLRLVDEIERAPSDTWSPQAQAVAARFKKILDDENVALEAAGLPPLGNFGDSYVPHQLTDDFRRLMKKNADAKQDYERTIGTQEGFEQFRTVRPETPEFMGVALDGDASIANLNRISVEKYGVKIFKDDIREIIPTYTRQAADTLRRAEQVRLLGDAGIVGRQAEKVVKDSRISPEYKAERARLAQERLDAIAGQKVAVRVANEPITVLRRELPEIRKDLAGRVRQMAKAEKGLDDTLRGLQREQLQLSEQLTKLDEDIALKRAEIEANVTAAKAVRGQRKAVLLRRSENARKQLELLAKRRENLVTGKTKGVPFDELPIRLEAMADRRLRLEENIRKMSDEMDLLLEEQTPIGLGPTPPEVKIRRADQQLSQLLDRRKQVLDQVEAATHVYAFAQANSQFPLLQLRNSLVQLETAKTQVEQLYKGTLPDEMRRRLYTEAVDRYTVAIQVLEDVGRVSPQAQLLARLLAAEAPSDLSALASRDQIALMDRMIEALKDKKFNDVIKLHVEKGMKQIGDSELQIPDWTYEALKARGYAADLDWVPKAMQRYFNLFKGYALLRSGFHVRNAYSAMYNMYLEAGPGALMNIKKFDEFYRAMSKDGIESAKAKMVSKYGQQTADRLEQSWEAALLSGSGGMAAEFKTGALQKARWNPLSEDFGPLRLSRRWGSWIEDHIRGAHAFDVLERGGSPDMAADILNKWHFNYDNVTSFDQRARLVNPFWVFWSRNLALQSQTWVQKLSKYNRTLLNIDRNFGYGLPEDEYKPEWFTEAGAIRVGQGDEGGIYWFSDLPTATWIGQIDQMTNPGQMSQILGQTGPWLNIPLQAITGKQLFSGIPIKQDEYVPLPTPLRQLLGGAAPGGVRSGEIFGTSAEGNLLLREPWALALQSAIPGLGQYERLFPGTEKGKERAGAAWLSYFTGIGAREVDERTARGEQYRRMLEESELERRLSNLEGQ